MEFRRVLFRSEEQIEVATDKEMQELKKRRAGLKDELHGMIVKSGAKPAKKAKASLTFTRGNSISSHAPRRHIGARGVFAFDDAREFYSARAS